LVSPSPGVLCRALILLGKCRNSQFVRKISGRAFYNFLVIIGLANMLFLAAECAIEGGSASFGTVANGHYYLYRRGYSKEVSARLFRVNQLHGYTIYLTTPLLLLGLALRRLTDVCPPPSNQA
jgi:hypothetical protein